MTGVIHASKRLRVTHVCEQLVLQAGTHPGYQRGARTPANLFPLALDAAPGRPAQAPPGVTANAASRLGVSKDWLYRNSGGCPSPSAKGIERRIASRVRYSSR